MDEDLNLLDQQNKARQRKDKTKTNRTFNTLIALRSGVKIDHRLCNYYKDSMGHKCPQASEKTAKTKHLKTAQDKTKKDNKRANPAST